MCMLLKYAVLNYILFICVTTIIFSVYVTKIFTVLNNILFNLYVTKIFVTRHLLAYDTGEFYFYSNIFY